MMDFVSSPWVPAVALLLLTCAARVLGRSWLVPSAFAALLWSAFVWVSMLTTDYPVYAPAVWVIVLVILALQLGAFVGVGLFGDDVAIGKTKEVVDENALNRKLLRYCVILSAITVAGAVYLIFWSFERFGLSASLISFFSIGHLFSAQYADYGELEPWPVRLTIMWAYPAALLGGIAFATAASRKGKLLSCLPFLPSLLVGSAVAARSGILLSTICWMSGYLGVKHWQDRGEYRLFRRRFVLVLTALGFGAVILFVLVDALRHTRDGQTFVVALDLPRFYKYSLGSLGGFSSWFEKYRAGSPTLGAYTFGGILDLLGLHRRKIGLYQDFESLSGGQVTNIYTALRGLIEDFTLVGTVCISMIVGFVSAVLLRSPSRKTAAPIVFGSACYAFILCSPITSIFTYNGLILAWVTATLVLRAYCRSRGLPVFRASVPVS